MTKSPRKNVPDVGIKLGAACMPSELASERKMIMKGLRLSAIYRNDPKLLDRQVCLSFCLHVLDALHTAVRKLGIVTVINNMKICHTVVILELNCVVLTDNVDPDLGLHYLPNPVWSLW